MTEAALVLVLVVVLAILILVVLALFVIGPLRRSRAVEELREESLDDPVIADLEARKEAKYREIRDAELDREQGKLSVDDWRRQDAELRREAVEILKQLDQARGDAAKQPH